jgi:hypothetical protein
LIPILALAAGPATAADYTVDFTRIDDLESLRPLVQQCGDFDALEIYRDKMQNSTNLETTMRDRLAGIGFALFNDCPDNLSGPGIAEVRPPEISPTMDYAVDFTRVKNFATLRPLVTDCRDFGGLESFRPRLEKAADNLEDMRKTLVNLGFGMFEDCPQGVAGPGITPSR